MARSPPLPAITTSTHACVSVCTFALGRRRRRPARHLSVHRGLRGGAGGGQAGSSVQLLHGRVCVCVCCARHLCDAACRDHDVNDGRKEMMMKKKKEEKGDRGGSQMLLLNTWPCVCARGTCVMLLVVIMM